MSEGWIKLHRKLLDSSTFDNEKILKVWVWALLKASHRKQQIVLGYQKVTLNPGEFIYGRFSAADELKMSASTVRNCLAKLSEFGNLDIKSTNKFSIVKIKGWELYQGDGQQNNSRITADGQQNATYNNVKNDKNVKNIYKKKEFLFSNDLSTKLSKLSLEELIQPHLGKYSPKCIKRFLLHWTQKVKFQGQEVEYWQKEMTLKAFDPENRLEEFKLKGDDMDYQESNRQRIKNLK